MMKDSVMYTMDLPVMKMSWYANGAIKDSSVTSIEGDGVHVYWFDNGQPSHSGRTYRGKKERKWQYFHKNGKLAAIEEYVQDKLLSRQYFDEEGVPLTDTTGKDKAAEFKGGNSKLRSYLANTLQFPGGVSLKNTTKITVVVNAIVDEEGNITDAYVSVPVHPRFDDEALRIMKRSPKWMPAIDHNRRVKFSIRQPISFTQMQE